MATYVRKPKCSWKGLFFSHIEASSGGHLGLLQLLLTIIDSSDFLLPVCTASLT